MVALCKEHGLYNSQLSTVKKQQQQQQSEERSQQQQRMRKRTVEKGEPCPPFSTQSRSGCALSPWIHIAGHLSEQEDNKGTADQLGGNLEEEETGTGSRRNEHRREKERDAARVTGWTEKLGTRRSRFPYPSLRIRLVNSSQRRLVSVKISV